MCHLDALSKRDGVDGSIDELLEFFESFGGVWKQNSLVCWVLLVFDGPVADPVVNPMRANLQPLGKLVWPHIASDDVRVAQFFVMNNAVLFADARHG